ncbi:MAG: T9SS type A sorting domain-containing protein [Ignavibacteria bacterium]
MYDVLGNEVATLVNEKQSAGSYSVEFDGNGFASGVYFYRLSAGDFVETKRMILLK